MPTTMGVDHEQMNGVATHVEYAQSHGIQPSWRVRVSAERSTITVV